MTAVTVARAVTLSPAHAARATDGIDNRTIALDGLRGLAALMVFVHHADLPGSGRVGLGLDSGVLLFFSLSGYLLFRPLVAGNFDPVAYAARRAFRIMPAYLVAAFAIAFIWYPWFLANPLALVTMQPGPILVLWTLVIEVAFYAVLPFIALGLRRVRRPELWIAWGALASLGIGALELAFSRTSPIGFLGWAWAFAPGMLVALPVVRTKLASVPTAAIGFGLLAVSVLFDLGYPDLPAAAGAGLLVASALKRPALGGRVAIGLGATSYSMYLWHEPIIGWVDRPATWVGALVALLVTSAIAATIYVVVERPAIRLAHRIRGPRPSA